MAGQALLVWFSAVQCSSVLHSTVRFNHSNLDADFADFHSTLLTMWPAVVVVGR